MPTEVPIAAITSASRRKLLLGFVPLLTLAPRVVFAQSKQAPVVIGLLNGGSRASSVQLHAAFREGLAALGMKGDYRVNTGGAMGNTKVSGHLDQARGNVERQLPSSASAARALLNAG